MKIGIRNGKFGWLWLALFVILGLILATNKEANVDSPKGTIDYTEELIRSVHAHGSLLSILNIVYGLYIDKAQLSDGLKNIGSWLAIAGAVILPLSLIGLAFGLPTGAISAIGGLSIIIAVLILGFGYVKASE